jgi:hypothetical protein
MVEEERKKRVEEERGRCYIKGKGTCPLAPFLYYKAPGRLAPSLGTRAAVQGCQGVGINSRRLFIPEHEGE